MSGVREAKSEQTDLSVLSGIEHKEQISWDELLQMLEEWFADGTDSFEACFNSLQNKIQQTENEHQKENLMKVSKVMGFLRGIICWHRPSCYHHRLNKNDDEIFESPFFVQEQ